MPATKISLSKNALFILEQRYLKKNDKGKTIEKPQDLFRRVATSVAKAESLHGAKKTHVKKIFAL